MPLTWTRPANLVPLASEQRDVNVLSMAARAVSPQAAADMATHRAESGSLLVQLFHYLEANVEKYPALAPAIARLSSAVAEYRSGQDADPYAGVRAVVDAIQSVRRADPRIPEP
jgi:hypothetical protein